MKGECGTGRDDAPPLALSGAFHGRGVKFIRPVFVTMVILTTLKLLYNRFF